MFEPEEYRIVRRIKDFVKSKKYLLGTYIMLRNRRILDIYEYRDMVRRGRINPQNAYVYIITKWAVYKADFYYPFLDRHTEPVVAYLSKLGFYYGDHAAPATGLKYVVGAIGYAVDDNEKYLIIELVNLDTVVNNTNLRTITFEVLGDKIISGEKKITREEYGKILDPFEYQRLIAGHNFYEASDIIHDYYDKGNTSLAKEVARITIVYDRIFQPYRVCYDMKTWKEVDCWSIR